MEFDRDIVQVGSMVESEGMRENMQGDNGVEECESSDTSDSEAEQEGAKRELYEEKKSELDSLLGNNSQRFEFVADSEDEEDVFAGNDSSSMGYGEFLSDVLDLPSVSPSSLKELGIVHHVVENSLVIQSLEGQPALDSDTIVFSEDGSAVGKVVEFFGPVKSPLYIIQVKRSTFESTQSLLVDSARASSLRVFTCPEHLIPVLPAQIDTVAQDEDDTEQVFFSDDEEEHRFNSSTSKKNKKNRSNRRAPLPVPRSDLEVAASYSTPTPPTPPTPTPPSADGTAQSSTAPPPRAPPASTPHYRPGPHQTHYAYPQPTPTLPPYGHPHPTPTLPPYGHPQPTTLPYGHPQPSPTLPYGHPQPPTLPYGHPQPPTLPYGYPSSAAYPGMHLQGQHGGYPANNPYPPSFSYPSYQQPQHQPFPYYQHQLQNLRRKPGKQ